MFDVSELAAFSCLMLLLMFPIFSGTGLLTFVPACSIGDTFTLRSVFNLRMIDFERDRSTFSNVE